MGNAKLTKNKRTFSWINPEAEVRKTEKNGKGLFAKTNIKKGEKVAIFGGYIMTLKEFFKLPPDVMHYASQIDEEMVMGIKKMSELEDSCFFNHSCDPNLGYRGQIFLVAMRNIRKNEELCFDYGMDLHPSKTRNPKDVKRFDKLECQCGSKRCRKIVTEYDWELPELQKKYDGYFQWFVQEKINKLKNKK
ncbi:MAG: SET domain-containing methyltransferase [Parcubacteria group bacterium]|jgi:SET domain-containing protein